ncbi:hypothetical protein G6N76_12630 [Rhizobium daejeonense]|uniref:Helix-turn-helix transcriptional regulator n=1 Tax=Rhizobium daejeonense TaxID=240521 RepID=A0A6M1RSV8_9HYPH|nr:hypothetical protein [Rhizobium daejeonense]NGO64512.1 hypothetical protein [Rhizobium daejeonense]
MATPAQIRAARALLGITVDQLSAKSGISAFLIIQTEAEEQANIDPSTLHALKLALQACGILFISDGDSPPGGAGVRFAERDEEDDGVRPEDLNAANDD